MLVRRFAANGRFPGVTLAAMSAVTNEVKQ
jgi:hypothetical protein